VFITGSYRIGLKGLTLLGPFEQNGNERGDGIYIRHSKSVGDSKMIVIMDCTSEGASRNGISMVGAENVWIENVVLKNFSGAINAALDLEPEAGDTVKMVTVKNLTVSGENVNLYTHEGTVTDVLLQNIKLPNDKFVLEGNVSNVQIESSEASMLSMEAASTDIGEPRSVVVRNSVFAAGSNPQAVFLAGESVTFEQCEFIGGTKAAVRDTGTSESITIRNSVIRGSAADGVIIYKPKRIELSGNKVYDNARDGLQLGNKNSPILTASITGGNEVYNNGRNGMLVEMPKANIVITGAVISGNKENGIFLTGSLSASIASNTISSNKKGIFVSDYDTARSITNVTIIDNTITNPGGTQQYGIHIVKGSGVMTNVQVWNNTVTGSLTQNMLITPKAAVSAVQAAGNQLA
jgi:parallel beta-helix repeat protein